MSGGRKRPAEDDLYYDEEDLEGSERRPEDYPGDGGQQAISYMVDEFKRNLIAMRRQKGKAPSIEHPSHMPSPAVRSFSYPSPVDCETRDPSYVPSEGNTSKAGNTRVKGRGRPRGSTSRGRGTVRGRGRGRGSNSANLSHLSDVSSASSASNLNISVAGITKALPSSLQSIPGLAETLAQTLAGLTVDPIPQDTQNKNKNVSTSSGNLPPSVASALNTSQGQQQGDLESSTKGVHWRLPELRALILGANHLKVVLKGRFKHPTEGAILKELAWKELQEYVIANGKRYRSIQQCKDKINYFGQDARRKRQRIDNKYRTGSGQRDSKDYLDDLEQAICDYSGEEVILGIPGMQPPDLKGGERPQASWSCYDPYREDKEDYTALCMPSKALEVVLEGDMVESIDGVPFTNAEQAALAEAQQLEAQTDEDRVEHRQNYNSFVAETFPEETQRTQDAANILPAMSSDEPRPLTKARVTSGDLLNIVDNFNAKLKKAEEKKKQGVGPSGSQVPPTPSNTCTRESDRKKALLEQVSKIQQRNQTAQANKSVSCEAGSSSRSSREISHSQGRPSAHQLVSHMNISQNIPSSVTKRHGISETNTGPMSDIPRVVGAEEHSTRGILSRNYGQGSSRVDRGPSPSNTNLGAPRYGQGPSGYRQGPSGSGQGPSGSGQGPSGSGQGTSGSGQGTSTAWPGPSRYGQGNSDKASSHMNTGQGSSGSRQGNIRNSGLSSLSHQQMSVNDAFHVQEDVHEEEARLSGDSGIHSSSPTFDKKQSVVTSKPRRCPSFSKIINETLPDLDNTDTTPPKVLKNIVTSTPQNVDSHSEANASQAGSKRFSSRLAEKNKNSQNNTSKQSASGSRSSTKKQLFQSAEKNINHSGIGSLADIAPPTPFRDNIRPQVTKEALEEHNRVIEEQQKILMQKIMLTQGQIADSTKDLAQCITDSFKNVCEELKSTMSNSVKNILKEELDIYKDYREAMQEVQDRLNERIIKREIETVKALDNIGKAVTKTAAEIGEAHLNTAGNVQESQAKLVTCVVNLNDVVANLSNAMTQSAENFRKNQEMTATLLLRTGEVISSVNNNLGDLTNSMEKINRQQIIAAVLQAHPGVITPQQDVQLPPTVQEEGLADAPVPHKDLDHSNTPQSGSHVSDPVPSTSGQDTNTAEQNFLCERPQEMPGQNNRSPVNEDQVAQDTNVNGDTEMVLQAEDPGSQEVLLTHPTPTKEGQSPAYQIVSDPREVELHVAACKIPIPGETINTASVIDMDQPGLPSFAVMNTEEVVIVQNPQDKPAEDEEEAVRILNSLQDNKAEDYTSGADTEGSVSDRGFAEIKPLKRSSRIKKKKVIPSQ